MNEPVSLPNINLNPGEETQKSIDSWKESFRELPDITLNLEGLQNKPIDLPQVKFQEIKGREGVERFVNELFENKSNVEDKVNNPSHYNAGEIECIDAIAAALTPDELKGFVKGNVIKYLWRTEHKGGLEDLKKAQWYLDYLIKKLEEK
jgi:hypothetical protein